MRRLDGLLELMAVAEHGGFSAAARALEVSTAYVSRRVAALEARLGVRLLQRSTRRVQLTELGAQYLEQSRGVLAQIDAVEEALAEQQQRIAGRVRVAAGGWVGERVVAPALARLCAEQPLLQIELQLSDRRVDLIREGFDLAVRHGAVLDPDCVARRAGERRFVLAGAPAYLQARGNPQHPRDLVQHACLQAPQQPWRFSVEGGLIEPLLDGPFSSNGPALREAALAGLGLVRLADVYLQDALKDGRLLPLLEAFALPPAPTTLLYPSRKLLPLRVRYVLDGLAAALG